MFLSVALLRRIAVGTSLSELFISTTSAESIAMSEHAPIAIKASGVSCVIADTFARIFYRNSINIGLPIIECPEAVDAISEGDKLKADMDAGVIYNLTTGDEYKADPFPPFIQEIISTGGLIESIKAGKIK